MIDSITHVGRVVVTVSDLCAAVWVYRNDRRGLPAGISYGKQERDVTVIYSPFEVTRISEGPPPSETLRSLLRHFHAHRAVAPLIDCLIEEYPEVEPYLAGVLDTTASEVAV